MVRGEPPELATNPINHHNPWIHSGRKEEKEEEKGNQIQRSRGERASDSDPPPLPHPPPRRHGARRPVSDSAVVALELLETTRRRDGVNFTTHGAPSSFSSLGRLSTGGSQRGREEGGARERGAARRRRSGARHKAAGAARPASRESGSESGEIG
jgi:hypothetical protein